MSLFSILLLALSPACCREQIPHLCPSVCWCQQPLNNRWDPHPSGLSHLVLLIDRHKSFGSLWLRWVTGLDFVFLPACRPPVNSAGHRPVQQNTRGCRDSKRWYAVTGNWASETIAPPLRSRSLWLCEILTALDLHCHVKDERSSLP